MKYKKLSLVLCSGLMLFSGLGTSTILAAEEINKDDLLEEYGNIKNEVNGTFDSMKDKYTDLSNNFGKIEKPNVDEVYQSYLDDIKEGQKELEIDKKLEAIKNTDLSIDNSEMKKTYEEAKKEAANKLSEAQISSNAVKDKFDIIQKEQTEKEKQLEQKRIEAAETQYNNIVAGYYETLNKKGDIPPAKQLSTNINYELLKKIAAEMNIDYDYIMNSRLTEDEVKNYSNKTEKKDLFTKTIDSIWNNGVQFGKTFYERFLSPMAHEKQAQFIYEIGKKGAKHIDETFKDNLLYKLLKINSKIKKDAIRGGKRFLNNMEYNLSGAMIRLFAPK